jgi:hypothetical protein
MEQNNAYSCLKKKKSDRTWLDGAMIDENFDCDVFRKRSTLMPYAGYYLLCHIYKINIIKISWISAFYSYLNLKYLPSAFRMKMLDFESQFPQVLVNRFPWFKFGRKCDSLIWLDAKYQGFTWPWTWQYFNHLVAFPDFFKEFKRGVNLILVSTSKRGIGFIKIFAINSIITFLIQICKNTNVIN